MDRVYQEAKKFVPLVGDMLPNRVPGTQPTQPAQPVQPGQQGQPNPVPPNTVRLNNINPEDEIHHSFKHSSLRMHLYTQLEARKDKS